MIFQREELLGTHIALVFPDDLVFPSLAENAFAEAERIERLYSRFLEHNELSRINKRLRQWTSVSSEFFQLLKFGKQLEEETHGAFSLSVKSILESWGYNARYELFQEKGEGNSGVFELDEETMSVFLTAPVEMGAFGKGYALDAMAKVLEDIPDFFLNAGGDILAKGSNGDVPWEVFFEHPFEDMKSIGKVEMQFGALAASSPKRRKWRNRHHLVHAGRKKPAEEMAATYVQNVSACVADGYATALFVMGYENAKTFAIEKNIPAFLVSAQGDIFVHPLFEGSFF